VCEASDNGNRCCSEQRLNLHRDRSRLRVTGVGSVELRPRVTGRGLRVCSDEDLDGISTTSATADDVSAAVQRPTASKALCRRTDSAFQLLRVRTAGAQCHVVQSRWYHAHQQQTLPHHGLSRQKYIALLSDVFS